MHSKNSLACVWKNQEGLGKKRVTGRPPSPSSFDEDSFLIPRFNSGPYEALLADFDKY